MKVQALIPAPDHEAVFVGGGKIGSLIRGKVASVSGGTVERSPLIGWAAVFDPEHPDLEDFVVAVVRGDDGLVDFLEDEHEPKNRDDYGYYVVPKGQSDGTLIMRWAETVVRREEMVSAAR